MTDRTVPTEPTTESERDFLLWAIDCLMEINPSNYDHDDVCEMNSASVEVILAMQARLASIAATPPAPGAEVEPVAIVGETCTHFVGDSAPPAGTRLYLSPPTTDAIRAHAWKGAMLRAEVAALACTIRTHDPYEHAKNIVRELRALADKEPAGKPGEAEGRRPLDPDMPAQEMRLHMGEMTAQEMRTARAAIRWANSRLPAPPADGGGDGE
jgi:hypothetical protein